MNFDCTNNEEELKFQFCKYFNIDLKTYKKIDLITKNSIYEFKYGCNLCNHQNKTRNKAIAQCLYYIKKLFYPEYCKLEYKNFIIVSNWCALICDINHFIEWFVDWDNIYDFKLSPSNPDKKLVDSIEENCTAGLTTYSFNRINEKNEFINKIKEIECVNISVVSTEK